MRLMCLLSLLMLPLANCVCETIEPGDRGVYVVRGVVQPESPLPPGMFTAACLSCDVTAVSVRQQSREQKADCFSSDLQHMGLKLSVLFHVPEAHVVDVFTQYHGDPFDTLVAPRVQEAVKEATAQQTAEALVQKRDAVKTHALELARAKMGAMVVLDDLLITDVSLSPQMQKAIEDKMIQQQEAAKAVYKTEQAENEAKTAKAVAQGEADAMNIRSTAEAASIRARGAALRDNPGVMQLQLIEKWNGVSPQIVAGGSTGVNIVMPAVGKE